MKFLILFIPALVWASNGITIYDISGTGQANRPFSTLRVFAAGEFPTGTYPQARINGSELLTTQADVKNTWPDGSIKFCIVSFVVDNVPSNGNITVDFVQQSVSNTSSYLSQSDMLNFAGGAWDAQIQATGAGTVSARAMLQAMSPSTDITSLQARYWLHGSVVTQVVLEDATPSLAYDIGTDSNKSLHPIFVLTFYPGTSLGIKVEYMLENVWYGKWQDQTYSLALNANGNTVFSKSAFTQTAGSRWRKVFWAGAAPGGWTSESAPGVNIDYNFAYLIQSGAMPSYDLTKTPSASAISGQVGFYNSNANGEEPQWCYTSKNYCGSYLKAVGGTGARGEIALTPLWYTLYFYTHDPALLPVVFGNAGVSLNMGIHLRDNNPALFYDRASQYTAFGRPVSLAARPTDYFSTPTANCQVTCNPTPIGPVTTNNWSFDWAHSGNYAYPVYLMTGDWYLYQEIMYQAHTEALTVFPDINGNYTRHNDWGYISDAIQFRGVGWQTLHRALAVFVAADSTPEQTYLRQELNYDIEIWEGVYNITNGSFPPSDPTCPNYAGSKDNRKWCWGRLTAATFTGQGAANPIGIGDMGDRNASGDGAGILNASSTSLAPLGHPWMYNYVQSAYGFAKDMGMPIGALVQYLESFAIDVTLTSGVNPEHWGDYVWPIAQAGNNTPWLTSWTAWNAGYLSSYDPHPTFVSRAQSGEGYPQIARGALSWAYGLTSTVGGNSGTTAWNWMAANVQGQSALNDDPQWSFVPRVAGGAPPPVIPPPVTPPPVTPPPVTLSVVNAASQLTGSVSPGELVSLYQSRILPASAAMSDVSVTFNGTSAPLLYVGPNQINAVTPFGLSGQSSAALAVSYQGQTVAQATAQVVPATPAIFTANSSGTGQAVIVNSDNSFNSPTNPAAVGSTVTLFAAGAGVFQNPALTDGQIVAIGSTSAPTLQVALGLGGHDINQITYAGPVPLSIAGILQVNFVIRSNVSPGSAVPLTLTLGSARSPAVTMAVK
jgi:uncharacterized protein (TIGR03437 family)